MRQNIAGNQWLSLGQKRLLGGLNRSSSRKMPAHPGLFEHSKKNLPANRVISPV
jgi:hypothetical protein